MPTRLGASMSFLKCRIFDAVKRAGPDGILCGDLWTLIYAQRLGMKNARSTALKSHISQINQLIRVSGYCIKCGHGRDCYKLVTRESLRGRYAEPERAAAKDSAA